MICTVVAFYCYLNQGSKFTLNTVFFTACLSVGFMMRNTSPVGWVPLILLKIIYENSFFAFLVAGVTVAIPVVFACVWVDSIFYQKINSAQEFQWVFTSLNFLQVNVL